MSCLNPVALNQHTGTKAGNPKWLSLTIFRAVHTKNSWVTHNRFWFSVYHRHHGANSLHLSVGSWHTGQCVCHLSDQKSPLPPDPPHDSHGSPWRNLEAAGVCCLCSQQGNEQHWRWVRTWVEFYHHRNWKMCESFPEIGYSFKLVELCHVRMAQWCSR